MDRVFYDLEFHFTSGELLCCTAQDGRDVITESPGRYTVEVFSDDRQTSSLLTVHTDTLNAVQSTTRIVKVDGEDDAH